MLSQKLYASGYSITSATSFSSFCKKILRASLLCQENFNIASRIVVSPRLVAGRQDIFWTIASRSLNSVLPGSFRIFRPPLRFAFAYRAFRSYDAFYVSSRKERHAPLMQNLINSIGIKKGCPDVNNARPFELFVCWNLFQPCLIRAHFLRKLRHFFTPLNARFCILSRAKRKFLGLSIFNVRAFTNNCTSVYEFVDL